MAQRYRARLAYDGTAYKGFQRQREGIPTVQATVEAAITQVTRQSVTLVAAGRTDSGVHATGQVIAFDADWQHDDATLLRALNATLPDDIALQDLRQQAGFHPRYDARSRTYVYSVYQHPLRQPLLASRAWQITQPLDLAAMQDAAALLIGQHDFAAFGNPPHGTNTVRDLFRSEWEKQTYMDGWLFTYTVEATAFLQHMVRRLVGTLVEVGQKRLDITRFEQIFKRADLSQVRSIAPPQGLVFANVRYDDKIMHNSTGNAAHPGMNGLLD